MPRNATVGSVQPYQADATFEEEGTTIILSKPVRYGNKSLTEIHLKPMSYLYARRYGLPVRNGNADDPDFDKLGNYIQDLSALPPSVVNSLSFKDVIACLDHVVSYFRTDED